MSKYRGTSNDFVAWDLEMICDDPQADADEPADTRRTSPRLAAGRGVGTRARGRGGRGGSRLFSQGVCQSVHQSYGPRPR
jgi:hypothetical protein